MALKELKIEFDKNDQLEITYRSWLSYFGELISKARVDNKEYDYEELGNTLLDIKVKKMTLPEQDDYESYYDTLENFLFLYKQTKRKNKDISPKEVYQRSLKIK